MKTNLLTKFVKIFLAASLLVFAFGKASAQAALGSAQQSLHATVPGNDNGSTEGF
jgi:hypothetical protein